MVRNEGRISFGARFAASLGVRNFLTEKPQAKGPVEGRRLNHKLLLLPALSLLGVVFGAACSGSDFAMEGAFGDGDSAGDGDGDGDGDGLDPDEPEVELEESFRAPVVAGEYLFSANPETNRVARVHASTLQIEVLEAGNGPTFLAALPSGPTGGGALVLNEKSKDVSIFLTEESGRLLPELRLPVQAGASAWAVGGGGRFAIAWSRSAEGLLNAGDGYQDLTLLDFTGDEVSQTTLSVGFRPSRVIINEQESHAYAVSEPGISVINLESGEIERELSLPEIEDGTTRDVSFSLDGVHAFVRLSGSSEVLLVDTRTNERVTLNLPAVVTDLDLSGDGSLGVAVMRGGVPIVDGMGGQGGMGGGPSDPGATQSLVALFSVEDIFDAPSTYQLVSTSQLVGSAVVAEDASQVLLFTNASANNFLTILSLPDQDLRTVDLKAPVRAAYLTEDGAHGVALMAPPLGSSAKGAFALIPVEENLSPRIQGTETAPLFVSLSGEVGRAMVTTGSSSSAEAATYFGRFPGLQVDRIRLPSQPLSAGIVPQAGQGFVAQSHPEGRVTFIELETGVEKTVTGYELSSKVVQ